MAQINQEIQGIPADSVTDQTTHKEKRPDFRPQIDEQQQVPRKSNAWIRLMALLLVAAVAAVLLAVFMGEGDEELVDRTVQAEPDALDRFLANNPPVAPEPDALDRFLANNPPVAPEPDALDRFLANNPPVAPEPDALDRFLASSGSES